MIPEPLKSFVVQLQEATDKRRVTWEPSTMGVYYCNRNDLTVFIQRFFDDERMEASYTMRVVRTGGSEPAFRVTDNEYDYNQMRDLYSSVLINASNFGDLSQEFFS